MIDIVLAVHNRRHITLHCLGLLEQQTGVAFRITVVDDGSSDGTSEAIRERFPYVDVLQGDGSLWWAKATNLGLQHALNRSTPADYILLLNDDVTFDSTYLSCMERAAEAHPGCLIGSLSVYDDDPERVYWCGSAASFRQCRFGYVQRDGLAGCIPADSLPGRGMLVPREVFSRIGLLHAEKFPQHRADFDFSLRASKATYGLLCCCDTTLVSLTRLTASGNVENRERLSTFMRSFWDIRSANYLPACWRFHVAHHGVRAPWRFTVDMIRLLGQDVIWRMGLMDFFVKQE